MALAARLNPAPREVTWLALGLATVAGSAFVYLGAADRRLGTVPALPLGILWTVSNVLAPALLVPFEQETARLVAHRRAGGDPYRDDVTRLAMLAGFGVATLAIVVALERQTLVGWLFPGQPGLLIPLVGIFAAFAAQHVSRGVLAGTGRMTRYGVQLFVDGGLRICLVLAIAVTGLPTISAFAAALVLAPAASVVATIPPWRRLRSLTSSLRRCLRARPPGRTGTGGARMAGGTDAMGRVDAVAAPAAASNPLRIPWAAHTRAVAVLVTGQVASTVIIGGGAVAARAFAAPVELPAVATLVSVLLVARAPLLAFYAVQPALIPRLARLDSRQAFRHEVRLLVVAVAYGGVVVVGLGFLAGPFAVRPRSVHRSRPRA